jgi:urease accessory protein
MTSHCHLTTMRLLQLASPVLPVGAYSYSQGLEHAVECAVVTDEASAAAWIEDALHFAMAAYEGPMLRRMLDAARRDSKAELHRLNAEFLASRETAELRAETVQMGHSAARLLGEIDETRALLTLLAGLPEPSYPCAWACAATAFRLPVEEAYAAYLWSWLENQVMAALKLVPLGQSAGQRILTRLGAVAADCAMDGDRPQETWTNFAPGLALASTLHETQYSRLFRS